MNVRTIAERTAHLLGVGRLLRAKHRSSLRILMYHRFHGSPEEIRGKLAMQCEHLVRHYLPVSLSRVAESVRENRPLPPNALAITVDDGYRDFEHAFPVFRDFGLKVTLYAVSGFAAGELWLWPDRLLYLLETSPLPAAKVPLPGGTVRPLDLSNPRAAFESFAEELLAMKNQDRLSVMDALPALLETGLPAAIPERFAPLTWDRLRALSSQGLDIGAHTATHPIVSRLETPADLDAEIAGCKARLESELGKPVRHFCYPNGKLADIDDAAIAAVQKSGFETAVLAETGLGTPPLSLFLLRRVGVDPAYPPLFFERCVAGYRL